MTGGSAPAPLEVWAGVECTVRRAGDQWDDQLERSGHARRHGDVALLAALGVRTVRYPVLWERVMPEREGAPRWRWSDTRLAELRVRGMRPVVGLLHHGSGPRWTSLIDPDFPGKLARFARRVAERYPWVDAYTPINEPLTTARFSGLYGHWYPHMRDDATFARILLAECRATVLAMRAIRAVNPGAQLVQTEDLGKTQATPPLAYQAEFENARRWLTFDLLTGQVTRGHPMRDYLRRAGASEGALEEALAECCAPDLVAINHYVTSERFLDHRLDRYPSTLHGGNGRGRYADVEAVRVAECELAGPRQLLREVWERYRRPVIISEAHLGGTREQQLRWLAELWDVALACRTEGAEIRAVTAWAAFGAYDWASLLTRTDGQYEPGLFDVRAPRPRPTALAAMVRDLATRGRHDHPALDAPGWWACETRFLSPAPSRSPRQSVRRRAKRHPPRRIAITGAGGLLGSAFVRLCEARGLPYVAFGRQALDIADADRVERMLETVAPWAVVNAAGYVRVDDAESNPTACRRCNVEGAAVLAAACVHRGVALLTFSSDLVFDGGRASPYMERDTPAPLGTYGRSKAEAERLVAECHPGALIVRTSACFGPWDTRNFVTRALHALSHGQSWEALDDIIVSPTYVPDLVDASLDLLVDRESGIWHLANNGAITWAELARQAATRARVAPALVCPRSAGSCGLAARRPRYSVLGSQRGALMPTLDDALARYVRTCVGIGSW
jgi:dTDP-4-dehydrorhamnose reductase